MRLTAEEYERLTGKAAPDAPSRAERLMRSKGEPESELQNRIVAALVSAGYIVEITLRDFYGAKRAGGAGAVTKGIPDLLVWAEWYTMDRPQGAALYGFKVGLEVKTATGTMTPEQKCSFAMNGILVIRSPTDAVFAMNKTDDYLAAAFGVDLFAARARSTGGVGVYREHLLKKKGDKRAK